MSCWQIIILVFLIAGDIFSVLKRKHFQIHSAYSGRLSLREDEILVLIKYVSFFLPHFQLPIEHNVSGTLAMIDE